MASRLNAQLRTHWPTTVLMLVAVLAFALVGVWVGHAGAADQPKEPTEWLTNQGFDSSDGELNPSGWDVIEPAVDAAAVVTAEERDLEIYTAMQLLPTDGLGPVDGEGMLRLGILRDKDSHQIKGPVTVSQDFYYDGQGTISLSYRAFTWEHRSGDHLLIEVSKWNPEGSGDLAVGTWSIDHPDSEPELPDVGEQKGGPEAVAIIAPVGEPPGKQKYWASSGWSEVRINLQDPGSYTLSYTLTNREDASHDTWVYIDHVNEPPVAVLNWAPDESQSGEPPHEGDIVGLYGDESYDPDGSIVKWEWEITSVNNPDVDLEPYYGPVGFIVPPDGDDKYTVKLTVWDDEGLYSEAGAEFEVQNAAPHVNVLNVIEVLKGTEGQLMGRFVDPGWEDVHDATWTYSPAVSGTDGSAGEVEEGEVQEDHRAPVSSGQVLGTFPATDTTGIWNLTLSVVDAEDGEDVATDPDPSEVHVVDYPSDWREPGESETGDPRDDPDVFPGNDELWSDRAYLSYIQSQGDVDIFEVKLPDGDPIPMGTEVLVTLRGSSGDYDLPADYDLVVFEGVEGSGEGASEEPQAAPFMKSQFQPAAFMHSGFMNSGFMNSAFMNSGFMNSAFMNSPFEEAAFMHSPFRETGFMNSGFMNSGFMNSAFMHSPFAKSAFMNSGFMNSAFMHSAFMHSAFMHSEYADTAFMHSPIDGYPLSAMSFTGTEHNNTSGTDISFDELGFDLGALPQNVVHDLRALGFSANSGTEQEVVLATAGYPQTDGIHGHVYVAVKSSQGAYSASSPYTLQIETSVLTDMFAFTSADLQSPLVDGQEWLYAPSGSDANYPVTLFVTQLDRLKSLYPTAADPDDPRNGGQIVLDALESIASSSVDGLVEGKVVNLPADIYDAWDREPWRVDLANGVAQRIRSVIQEELDPVVHPENAGIKYVVLVGNDRIIPFRRLIDQTIIGNEQYYADQSFLTHFRYEGGELVPRPSATLASIANGYILTDDYYGDAEPISWGGSHLYIPDVSVSRLVETPGEIADTIAAFIDEEGTLSPSVGLVTGYDFMTDGADNVSRILTEAGLPAPTQLIGGGWSGDALRAELLADGDAANVNAHFTHFAGLSPIGYEESIKGTLDDVGELLLSSDIADGSAGSFLGRLVFSMGCHAGLNVPDEQRVEVSPESPIMPALDFPQAMMQQGGIYLGSTGFGYGDTVGIAGTEALIGFFAEQLVGGGADQSAVPPAASVGLALTQAKQEYLGSLTSLTPYDQKSSVEFTLYGMPQYQLGLAAPASENTSASAASVLAAAGDTDAGTVIGSGFQLSLGERSMDLLAQGDDNLGALPSLFSQSYILRQCQGYAGEEYTGEYITADNKAEATPDRPIHPVAPVDVDPSDDYGPAHGFVYTGGTYEKLSDAFQPVIARPTTEWEVDPREFQVATSEFWPVEPGSLTTRETGDGGYDQTFIAVPAQFKPEPGTDPIEGTERVWSSLTAELLRSTEPDWAAPIVRDLDLWMANGQLVLSLDAHDASGISRIVALQLGTNEMYVPIGGDHYFGGTPNEGRYELTMDLPGVDPRDISLLVQVVDGWGNVTRLTGKGATISLKPGLRNPGFEERLKYWDVTEPVNGNADAVQADNYASPYAPSWMLRLGLPDDDGNAHQVKGVTSVSQQFISEGEEEIVVAYLLKTVDGRDFDDEFVISVTDAGGNNLLEPPFSITNAPVNVTGIWEKVHISLPYEGVYTLTYTLDNTNSAAKNSWVYIDQGD